MGMRVPTCTAMKMRHIATQMQYAVSVKPMNNDAILANPTNTSPWYAYDFCIHRMNVCIEL